MRRGEAVGLLGPNGAGKTTVFYMITGLVKPDKGEIELDGHNVTGLPMFQRARLGVGYLPQEASIFRGLNVEDNIRAVLEVNEPNRRAREAMLDAVSMYSDSLMEKMLEGDVGLDDATVAIVYAAIRAGTISNKLVPVCMGSAYRNKGVQ